MFNAATKETAMTPTEQIANLKRLFQAERETNQIREQLLIASLRDMVAIAEGSSICDMAEADAAICRNASALLNKLCQ